jgi:hypothetical protein
MIDGLRCLMFSGVVLALCLPTSGVAQKNKTTPLHALPGNGVADPADKMGFFPNTSGGIDALNLATGKVLWSSKEANLPLITTETHLYALKGSGNQLRVVKMDTSKEGQRVFESPPIALPGWASVETAYGRRFRSSVRLDSNGLFVIWEAGAFYAGGAPPPPELLKREQKQEKGVARIHMDTGKIESLDADKIGAGKFFPISAVAANAKLGAITLLVKDGSANNPKNPFERRRTLQAVTEAKQVVWQRDIAPPIELPRLP